MSARLTIALKAAAGAAAVLIFYLLFLAATLADSYQQLGMSRYAGPLSESGVRLDEVLSDNKRRTLDELREVVEQERDNLLKHFRRDADTVDPAGLLNLAITVKNGDVIVSTGRSEEKFYLPRELRRAAEEAIENNDISTIAPVRNRSMYYLASPMFITKNEPTGMVMLKADPDIVQAWVGELLMSHGKSVAVVGALCLLAVVVFVWFSQEHRSNNPRIAYKPILTILFITQLVLLYIVVTQFHRNQTEIMRDTAATTTQVIHSIVHDGTVDALGRLSDYERKKLDQYVESNLGPFEAVTIADETGKVIFARTSDAPKLPALQKKLLQQSLSWIGPKELWVSAKLSGESAASGRYAMTVVHISEDWELRKSLSLVSNGLTMLLVSFLLAIEVLLILAVVGRRAKSKQDRNRARVKFMRPAMFFFLFGIDLSMAFVPLHMHDLYVPMLGLPRDLALGLPISVEFLFVGLFFLLAGFWVDKRGWHEPFVIGVTLACLGVAYSWYAPDAVQFILSRALVGVGYGMALMASQGFVVIVGGSEKKATGLASLFAGLYAGSVCGAVAGAVLAEQFGYRFVFLLGAVVVFAVVPYTFAMMRQTMQRPAPAQAPETSERKTEKALIRRFLADPTVLSLIFLSSLPASIAVAGFIHFFTPAYLDTLEIRESMIGQILMIYGMCQIFLGPRLGQLMDRSSSKKMFVIIGNLFGSAAFVVFFFVPGVPGVAIAVLLLGISSSFVLASQSTMLLSLEVSKRLGQGVAIGIFRSSSRIGQVIGPMLFGGVLLASDIEVALTYLGVFYFVTMVLFVFFAREKGGQFAPGKPTLDAGTS